MSKPKFWKWFDNTKGFIKELKNWGHSKYVNFVTKINALNLPLLDVYAIVDFQAMANLQLILVGRLSNKMSIGAKCNISSG